MRIRGDRFFDYKPDYKGKITFFSLDVFDKLRRHLRLQDVRPEYTRRNVFPSGVMNLAFRNQEAEDWLKNRGGLRARLLSDGVLRRDIPTS